MFKIFDEAGQVVDEAVSFKEACSIIDYLDFKSPTSGPHTTKKM